MHLGILSDLEARYLTIASMSRSHVTDDGSGSVTLIDICQTKPKTLRSETGTH